MRQLNGQENRREERKKINERKRNEGAYCEIRMLRYVPTIAVLKINKRVDNRRTAVASGKAKKSHISVGTYLKGCRGMMVCSNVPHYWVLGGYGWVHGAEITKQRQLLTNTKHDKSSNQQIQYICITTTIFITTAELLPDIERVTMRRELLTRNTPRSYCIMISAVIATVFNGLEFAAESRALTRWP